MYCSTLLSGATLFKLSIAGYVLQDDYMKDFYGNFDFFTGPDPTNGFVKYVDQATAESTGLISSNSSGAASWGVDSTSVANDGRSSLRIVSKNTYDKGLVILDVEHMPVGCGTWPAFWMVGPSWPDDGEIDILEGVNDQEVNAMTLHTGPGCAIAATQDAFSGDVTTDDCDVNAADQDKNVGCSIKSTSKQSYGAGLNDNKGGVYATQWTDEAISVYFFPRGEIPQDALGDNPDPTAWGTPAAQFASTSCDIASIFKQQQIVFDTTFCGDWAGNAWSSSSTCAAKADSCEAYVQDNPEAFANAYWTINSLKVYQTNGDAPAPSSSGIPVPSSSAVPVPSAPVSSNTSITISSVVGSTTAVPFPSVITSDTSVPTVAPPVTSAPSTFPSPSHTRRPHHSFSGGFGQSSQAQDSLAAAPTGGGNNNAIMSGFGWPEGNGNDSSNATSSTPVGSTSAPVVSGIPFPNATSTALAVTGTGVVVVSSSSLPIEVASSSSAAIPISTVQASSVAIPTSAAAVSSTALESSGAAPTSIAAVSSTIVPSASAPVPTTAGTSSTQTAIDPGASNGGAGPMSEFNWPAGGGSTDTIKARHARHVREHRRRMTQHHGRR